MRVGIARSAFWSWIGLLAVLGVVMLLAPLPAGGGPAGGGKRAVVGGYPPFNPANDGGGPYTSGIWIDNLPSYSYRSGGALDTRGSPRYVRWDFAGMTFRWGSCPSLIALQQSGDVIHDAILRMVPYVPGASNDGILAASETVPLRKIPIGQSREFMFAPDLHNDQTGAYIFAVGAFNGDFWGFSSQVTRLTKSSWKFVGAGPMSVGCPDAGGTGFADFSVSFEITISE